MALYVTKQKMGETELAFITRVNLASYHCVNEHSDV